MGPLEKCLLFAILLTFLGMNVYNETPHQDNALEGSQSIPCSEHWPCQTGCCSQDGICGVGPDFCSPETCLDCNRRDRRRCDGLSSMKRLVGYYELWTLDRPCNRVFPSAVPFVTYDQVNIAFVTINPVTFELNPIPQHHADLIEAFRSRMVLRESPQLFITISGLTPHDWSIHNASVFSELARSQEHQRAFLRSVISFLSTYNIDGVDINWEHPDGFSEDYDNLPTLMQNIKAALLTTGGRYGLTMTLPVSLDALHNYPLRRLPKYVDYFNLMPLDLHSQLRSNDTWSGTSLAPALSLADVEAAITHLWHNYIGPEMVNLGLPLYAPSRVPADPECTAMGCPATSGAVPGFSSNKRGMLMYSEIQDLINHETHQVYHSRAHARHDWDARALQPSVLDQDAQVRITMNEEQWIAFDDQVTLRRKVEHAGGIYMGGVAAWAVTHDTYRGDYGRALDAILGTRFKRYNLGLPPIIKLHDI